MSETQANRIMRLAGRVGRAKRTSRAGHRRVPVRRSPSRLRRLSFESLEGRRVLAAMIDITAVPDFGVGGLVRGQVSGVDPATHRVAPYIQFEGGGWWTKPTFANPTVPINADGTFQVFIGANDSRATIYSAAVVDAGYFPPQAAGVGRIPGDLQSLAIDHEHRSVRTIEFAGRTWAVKDANTAVGPGGNRFSSDEDDVFVDSEGNLHLTINQQAGNWWSTEVFLVDPLGYGTYSFQTDSSLHDLDANVTFGAFTWDPFGDDESGADPHREIDFEDGRWGDAGSPTNAQMVVQPFYIPGNLRRYTIPDQSSEAKLTRIFDWQPDQIEYTALTGAHDPDGYSQSDVIDQFTYFHNPSANHYVPTAGRATFRFNLWLSTGTIPANQQSVEVVISDFTFDAGAIAIGPTNRGIAVDDSATGTGYLMYSAESVHTRFQSVHVFNADHIIAVRDNQGQWEYNDNQQWLPFTPRSTDVLLADVDFSNDTVASLIGQSGLVNGINQGYSSGDLTFFADRWNGVFNNGEFSVEGSSFTLADSPSTERLLGSIERGIGVDDAATGTGWILHSSESLFTRFASAAPNPFNSEHLIAVRDHAGQWEYNDNQNWRVFAPVADDVLLAAVDFSNDTLTSLVGQSGQINGIDQGYVSGDLTFFADRWNGQFNNGEFTIEGTSFVVESPPPTDRALGPVHRGIGVDDGATGTGWILHSAQNLFTRLSSAPPNPFNSEHLIAVRHNAGQWEYNDNNRWRTFNPESTDILLAAVDFSNDTITPLLGQSGQINGIEQGYLSGDLTFFADRWNDQFNQGEFTVEGTSFLPN